ncbi:hypothetical protein EON65_13670 [archaeon]|nr:MAG: hypothetical protein EON65_13670 [archaeon]
MHISSRRNIEMWIEIILVVVLAVASGTDAFVSSYKKIGQSPFSNPASLISTYRSKTPSRFELPQSLNDSPQPVGTADQSDSKFFPSSTSNNTFRDFMIKLWSQNLFRRWVTGITLGIIGTLWISSGNGIFSLGFLFTSLIAQNEYFTMVRATGVLPASKTGTIACLVSYLTAAMIPEYHELVMPLSATLLMIWLLLFNKKVASINEISTSLLGMFYIGYLPSFWVRLRALDDLTKIRFSASLSKYLSQRWFDPQAWTVGAIVTWWTWCSIVCAGKLTNLRICSENVYLCLGFVCFEGLKCAILFFLRFISKLMCCRCRSIFHRQEFWEAQVVHIL